MKLEELKSKLAEMEIVVDDKFKPNALEISIFEILLQRLKEEKINKEKGIYLEVEEAHSVPGLKKVHPYNDQV